MAETHEEPFVSYAEAILARLRGDPAAVVIEERGRRVLGGELADLIVALAGGLEEAGFGHGSRIALLAPVSTEALAARYAAALLGATTVYCANPPPGDRLAPFVAHIDPDVLLVFPQTAGAAQDVIDRRIAPVAYSVGAVDGFAELGRRIGAAGDARFAGRVRPDDVAVLVSSGGTTGVSKASRRTFATYRSMVDAGPLPDRRLLVCTALAYVAQVLVDQAMLGGGTLVLQQRFEPAEVLAAVEAHRITHLGLVEPLLVELVDHPDWSARDLSSLVAITHIGAAAAPSLRARLLRRAGPILVHPYGASEAGIISVLAGPDYDVSRPELLGTAGRPLPGVEVLIETADGPAVERGAEGAIAVRSPAVADGYTAVVADSGFRDGRYYVGDLGFIDGDGYLHVRGRIRDALWVEGRSVLPVDIQDVLCRRADVRYAVAVPDGDPAHGYGVAIAAAARSTLTAAQAAELLETEIGIRPWAVAFVDRMPVTEQGKPDRRALAALFAAADRLDS